MAAPLACGNSGNGYLKSPDPTTKHKQNPDTCRAGFCFEAALRTRISNRGLGFIGTVFFPPRAGYRHASEECQTNANCVMDGFGTPTVLERFRLFL